jgi:DEAD/DEAH box helicase domain-containing protein
MGLVPVWPDRRKQFASGTGGETGLAPVLEPYEPNIFVYDNYPGGIGLSEPLFRLHDRLIAESLTLIENCPCFDGCPSCVGPAGEVGSKGKEVALHLLRLAMKA